MKTIEEALLLNNTDEIESEILERHNLIEQMVGNLYPSILYGEIDKLTSRRWEILKQKNNNKNGLESN